MKKNILKMKKKANTSETVWHILSFIYALAQPCVTHSNGVKEKLLSYPRFLFLNCVQERR